MVKGIYHMRSKLIIFLFTALFLSACGGGGDSNESTTSTGSIPPAQPVNNAPVLTIETAMSLSPNGNYELFAGESAQLTIQTSDPDGDTVTLTKKVIQGSGLTMTLSDSSPEILTLNFPDNKSREIFEVEITATDSKGATAKKTVTIQTYRPPVKTLAHGYDQSFCTLSKSGLQCTGDSYPIKRLPSNLEFVSEISLGVWHGCAISRGELRCWAHPTYQSIISRMPLGDDISGLRAYAVGSQCAHVDGEFTCWGSGHVNPTSKITEYASKYDVFNLANSLLYGCGINNNFMECELHWNKNHSLELKPGTYAHVVADSNFACVADAQGEITCYNETGDPFNPSSVYLSDDIWKASSVPKIYDQIKGLWLENKRLVIHADNKLICVSLGQTGLHPCSYNLKNINDVSEASLIYDNLCYVSEGEPACLTFTADDTSKRLTPEVRNFEFKLWKQGTLTGSIAQDSAQELTYQLITPPSVGDFVLQENGDFSYSVDIADATTTIAVYKASNNDYASNDGEILFRLVEQPIFLTECSNFGCNEVSMPYSVYNSQLITVIPAPEFYTFPNSYKLKNFKEGLKVTKLSSYAYDPTHECKVIGLELGDELPLNQEVNLQFSVKRTNGETKICDIQIEFDNNRQYIMALTLETKTN